MNNNTTSPATIKSSKGRTLYITPDGTGYETSKARRLRRLATTTTTR